MREHSSSLLPGAGNFSFKCPCPETLRLAQGPKYFVQLSSPTTEFSTWSIEAYRSVGELLDALRDAIRGHKSLLEDGKILHRDISENNIIITEAATKRDPKGMLIDLDLAKELDSLSSRASHRTGTIQFMAIEVLQRKGYTYRHDLESFFYVFTQMCIRYGYEDVGETCGPRRSTAKKTRTRLISISRLWGQYTCTYAEIV